MFCKYCGEQNPDNAVFCKKCGAKLNEGQPKETAAGNGGGFVSNNPNPPKKSFKIRPSVIAITAVVLVVIIAATQLFGGRSYKKTIDLFITSVMDGDGAGLVKTLPDELVEYGMEQDGLTSRQELEQEMEDLLGDPETSLDSMYGDDWSYEYEIVDTENYTSDELESLKEEYQTEIKDIKIKDAKKVTVKLTLKVKDEDDQSTDVDFSVIKIGKTWYIDLASMGSLF